MDRILVAEPVYAGMDPRVYANRMDFWKTVWMQDNELYKAASVVLGPRRNIRSARDIAIQIARSKGTHLLFLDDDILTPFNLLRQLHELNLPIVGGLIHKDDRSPVVFQDVDGGEVPWVDHPKKGVFECAAIGAGAMLIKVEVLNKVLESNRWAFTYDDTTERSMDIRFCRIARSLGFTVHCWPDTPCVQLKFYE